MTDGYGRNIDYLRISVTDKCNLRCRYCMPAEGVARIPHEELLTLEEIARIVRIGAGIGIRRVRLTGGEPLVRKNLVQLVRDIQAIEGVEEIGMTSNGVLFGEQGAALREAGLTGVNFSLDTLDPRTFREITGFDELGHVLEGIDRALKLGMRVKINCVPCREWNEGDICGLAALAENEKIDVRFIELMPVGCGRKFHGIPTEEIRQRLEERYGASRPVPEKRGSGPARYYEFAGFRGKIGFISPLSHKFCDQCNRVRLTAEGRLKLCLHYSSGVDLKPLLRRGAGEEEITRVITEALERKPREHDFEHFGSSRDSEEKKMVQIGG